MRDPSGRPLANTPFAVDFESRRVATRRVGGFSTDASGNYCILWANERILPELYVEGRYAGGVQRPWQPLDGASAPSGCQTGDSGIPWNRTDELMSTSEFISVLVTGIASLALLLLSLVLGLPAFGVRIRSAAAALNRTGLALTAGTTGLAFFVWFLLPPLQ